MNIDIGYAAVVSAIGDAIKARRKPLMTQGKFAERMGLSQPSVSDWERGESLPSAEQLPRIAAVLNCSVEDLVVGVDPSYDSLRLKRRDLIGHGRDQPSDFGRRSDDKTPPAASPRVPAVDPVLVKTLKNIGALVTQALSRAQTAGERLPAKDARTGTGQPGKRRRAGGDR